MTQQKVLTSGFVCEKGRALLLRRSETLEFLAGYWELPGGRVEFIEHPARAVIRETREEAGIECKVVCPYYVWDNTIKYKGIKTHFVEIDFILEHKPNQHITPGDNMDAAEWVRKEELRKYKITPEMKKAILEGFAWVEKNY